MSNTLRRLPMAVLIAAVLLAGAAAGQTSSTATGVSRLMNPAISANGRNVRLPVSADPAG